MLAAAGRARYRAIHSSGRWFLGSHWPNSSRWREDALLGAGALLVAARAADRGVEAVLLDRVEQRRGLEPVARGARARLLGDAAACRSTPARSATTSRSPSSATRRSRYSIASEKLCPVSSMQEREREPRRPEGLLGQAQEDDRVLAAPKRRAGPLTLRGDLADDVDGLVLQGLEMGSLVGRNASQATPVRYFGQDSIGYGKISAVRRVSAAGVEFMGRAEPDRQSATPGSPAIRAWCMAWLSQNQTGQPAIEQPAIGAHGAWPWPPLGPCLMLDRSCDSQ